LEFNEDTMSEAALADDNWEPEMNDATTKPALG